MLKTRGGVGPCGGDGLNLSFPDGARGAAACDRRSASGREVAGGRGRSAAGKRSTVEGGKTAKAGGRDSSRSKRSTASTGTARSGSSANSGKKGAAGRGKKTRSRSGKSSGAGRSSGTGRSSKAGKSAPRKRRTGKEAVRANLNVDVPSVRTGDGEQGRSNHIIGIMDPNSYSFRLALEGLFAHACTSVTWNGKEHRLSTRRIICRPYDTLECKTTCSAILNRGAHWNPHHNSFFSIVQADTYLLNDMVSFKAVDKNVGYGQMHRLGLRIPRTWAIPQEDYSDWYGKKGINLDLIFPEHELFDLAAIGEAVGYPAFLKPQDGGGWIGVERVENVDELFAAYKKSGKRPVNLQAAVDYKEFVRTVGIGPQVFPMHYNAKAEYPHFRYMRSPEQAVDFDFLPPERHREAGQLCKIINAFYNWDHNSCEALLDHEDRMWAIDFANAYPDSMLTSLHFYFPEIVKAMVCWLAFCAVSGRRKPLNYCEKWPDFFATAAKAREEGWDYARLLDEYERLADEHFDTRLFEKFRREALPDFDEKALEYFESDEFDRIVVGKCRRFFRIEHEVPAMIEHYRGIHRFWCYCERERLSSNG